MKRVLTSLFLCIFLMSGVASAYTLKIQLDSGGLLNNQIVDNDNFWINVNPGEAIEGHINISAYSDVIPGPIVPVAGSLIWGNREEQPWAIRSHISTGGWTDISVNMSSLNAFAPTDAGLYYILFASSATFTADQIMSATAWVAGETPVWYDGNDLGWDWTNQQFGDARTDGTVFGSLRNINASPIYGSWQWGATWVGINVSSTGPAPVPEPATMLLLGTGLVGLAGFGRKKFFKK